MEPTTPPTAPRTADPRLMMNLGGLHSEFRIRETVYHRGSQTVALQMFMDYSYHEPLPAWPIGRSSW